MTHQPVNYLITARSHIPFLGNPGQLPSHMPASLSFCEIQASEIVSFTVCCLYSDQHSKLEQGCELTYSSPGVWTVDQWPSQTNHRPTAEVTHSILVFQCGAFLTNAVQLYECSLIWSLIMHCIAFFFLSAINQIIIIIIITKTMFMVLSVIMAEPLREFTRFIWWM